MGGRNGVEKRSSAQAEVDLGGKRYVGDPRVKRDDWLERVTAAKIEPTASSHTLFQEGSQVDP